MLRRFEVNLSSQSPTTVFVGPNNSGKTSAMDALRLFTSSSSESSRFSIHDISQARQRDFDRLEAALAKTKDADEAVALVRRFSPRMRIDLDFSYSQEPADVIAASPLLMGLDASDDIVCLRIEYGIDNARGLLADFNKRQRSKDTLREFLADSLPRYFKRTYYKVDRSRLEMEKLEDGGVVENLIKVSTVPAQRHVDDDETSSAVKISRLLHEHFTKFYRFDDADGFESLEAALEQSTGELTKQYGQTFKRLTDRLKTFGYPQGHTPPDLRIRAEMNSKTLFKDNTRIFYANEFSDSGGKTEEFELPEKYNGLGYKNLIFIVLQIEAFQAALEAIPDTLPRVHVMAIEEPEAHLHPQMQCVFINEISKTLKSQAGVTAQIILSTHSSHIISNCGFEPVRYFHREGREVSVRDLSALPVPNGDPNFLDFLRRYLKPNHCDLFFADKAVFVEGQVERLLLPLMIEKCAELKGCDCLSSQYISISEVGGEYAQKFQPILDFLGIPTLIITDIDSMDVSGHKCPVSQGERTHNSCLRKWIPGKDSLVDLLKCTPEEKVKSRVCVAYQIGENGNCGRSFEEAFIYANADWLTQNAKSLPATGSLVDEASKGGIVQNAWDLSNKIKKVDLALDLMSNPSWKVPAYIREGLSWIASQRAK